MFHVGDTVIHPGHGICRVEAIQNYQNKPLYVLKLKGRPAPGDFKILVHEGNVKTIGLRHPISKNKVSAVFRILRKKSGDISKDSDNGYPLTREKVQSGNLYKIAEVVRDMEKQRGSSHISARKGLLASASSLITEEIAFVKKISKDRAQELIDNALKGE